MFLRTAEAEVPGQAGSSFPALFDRERPARRARPYDFDDVVTAPLHGFRDTDDYWTAPAPSTCWTTSRCRRWC